MKSYEDLKKDFGSMEIYEPLELSKKIALCEDMTRIVQESDLKHEVALEKELLIFCLKTFQMLSLLDRDDNITNFNREVSKFITSFKAPDFDYYLKQYYQTTNKSDRLRYGFVIWLLKKSTQYFEEVINLIYEYVIEFLKKPGKKITDYVLPCHLLCFSFNLVKIYMPKNSPLLTKVKDEAIALINNVKNTMYVRYLVDPISIIIRINNLDDNLLWELISNLNRGANLLNKDKKYEIQRTLLELSNELINNVDLNDDDKKALKEIIYEMIARSFEDQAKNREIQCENSLTIALDYKEAAQVYKKSRNDTKYKECYILYQKYYKFDESDVITYHSYIPEIEIYGSNEDDIIHDIIDKIQIPDPKVITDKIRNEIDNNPLLLAVSMQKLNDRGPSSEKLTDDKRKIEQLVKQRIVDEIQYSQIILSSAIYKLETDKKLTSEGIKNILQSNILNDKILSLIEHGIEEHFQQDYVSSIHILVPQIEALIRLVLQSKNLIVTKEKSYAIMDKELGGILDMKEDLLKIYSGDFIEYLKVILTDINGMNLRNKISHGLLNPDEFNHTNSFTIMMVLVLLTIKVSS